MKYEFHRKISAARQTQLESFLHEQPQRKRASKVVVYRGTYMFRHPKTGVQHEEYYVCTFMKGPTKLGVYRVVFVSNDQMEGFMKPTTTTGTQA